MAKGSPRSKGPHSLKEPFTISDAIDRLPKDVWILDAQVQPDAAERYRRACAHLFEITLDVEDAAFHNRLEGYDLGGAILARCQGVAQRFRRDRSLILADGSDGIQIVLQLSPTRWTCDYDGRIVDQDDGSIRFIDMARPFDHRTQVFETLNMMVPRKALGAQGTADLHGLVLSEEEASGRLLGSHLRALWQSLEHLTRQHAAAAAEATFLLAGAAIAAHAAPAAAEVRPVQKVLLAAARALVDARLDDPDLSPEVIHRELGISRSLLYQVCEPIGGVRSFIRERRLDRAFDVILADRARQHTLANIGYRHGFRSDAQFSRAFRQRYGIAPGRLREVAEGSRMEGLSIVERPDDVWAWLRKLS